MEEAWTLERQHLRAMPAHLPATCRVVARVADKFGHVRVDHVTYSVPIRHAYRPVWVKLYHDRVAVAVGAEVVAQHRRAFCRGAKVLDARQVVPLLERKHRAVGESTALLDWRLAPMWQRVRAALARHTRKPDQEWVRMLRLMETHPAAAVERAVTVALERHSPRLETVRLILSAAAGRPAAGVPAGHAGTSGAGAGRGAGPYAGGLRRPGGDLLMATAIAEPPHLAADLKTLCLSTIATEWRPVAEQATRQRQAPAEFLAQLVHLEVTGRRERRIQRRIQDARFPMLKTLDAFSFDAQPDLDRDAVLQVFDCGFVAEAANVVLVGGVGTGKTHLSIALGMACCQHDYRVRFVTAAELVTLLVEAQQQGRLARKLDQLARFDAVILDELGYVPFDKAGADLLFGFISQLYERRSLVVTTNLPFARWSEVFLDPTAAAAVIDRIVHHATVLQTSGHSCRLQAAKHNQTRAARRERRR